MVCSKKQWVPKIGEWKLKKNISSTEMGHIVRIQQKRKIDDGKETRVIVRGRIVAQENIDRWGKRHGKRQKTLPVENPDPSTPEDGMSPLPFIAASFMLTLRAVPSAPTPSD